VLHNAIKQSTKLITSLNFKRYGLSGILIHQQNSYATRSRQCTGRREAQSREPANKVKNLPVYAVLYFLPYFSGIPALSFSLKVVTEHHQMCDF
jgi:hypothetical protein